MVNILKYSLIAKLFDRIKKFSQLFFQLYFYKNNFHFKIFI
jgi:hypothetical protein